MADKSAIEWTDATWTPIRARSTATGKAGWHCEHVTKGCEHCYAESINKRLGTGLPFKPGLKGGHVELFLDGKMLLAPLSWKKPRMIFVCSMTDLFADFVPDAWIDKIFAVMALCPQHTFQVLTKRSARMREYMLAWPHGAARFHSWALEAHKIDPTLPHGMPDDWVWKLQARLPLPNVWLGVSCEDQENAKERVPDLLNTPAAIRFVSAEPLLGPIKFTDIGEISFSLNAFTGEGRHLLGMRGKLPGLNWIIVGGESGRQARPMHPDWARDIRDQCAATTGVSFFFKQWGEWLPGEANRGQFDERPMHAYRRCDDHTYGFPRHISVGNFGTHIDRFSGDFTTRRVGKKAAGRLLDGRTHDAMPAGADVLRAGEEVLA